MNYPYSKRIYSTSIGLEQDEEVTKKKQKAMDWVFNHTDDYFKVKYYISEEERWMRPHEEKKYLERADWHEEEVPLKYSFDFDDHEHRCVHCGGDIESHNYDMIPVDTSFGNTYRYSARICGTFDRGGNYHYLVGRYYYNKYSLLAVGHVDVLTLAEYMGSEKYTQ